MDNTVYKTMCGAYLQCLVTAGVSANVGQFGLVMSYTAVLLPQLKRAGSTIQLDEDTASWIAALPGFALLLGNFTVPTIMAMCGRKAANIISIAIAIVGWLCIVAAQSVTWLLIARLLQGFSMGMSTSLGPILIGEYTSPSYRGAFLSTVGLSMSVMTLAVHILGIYLSWKTTAVVCTVISLMNLVIILYSPESPAWLAQRGRYEDCERVFHWLRGDSEELELKKIIETSQLIKSATAQIDTGISRGRKIRNSLVYFMCTIKKKEFYKPIFIMVHMYMIANWGGINVLSAFTLDTFHHVMGNSTYDTLLVVSMDVQRIASNSLAVYLMRRVRRRTMLFWTLALNIAALAATALHTYLRLSGSAPYDSAAVGAVLIHVHTFSVVTGSLSLPMVIAGEVFSMQYKSLAGGISALFYSLNFLITVKTVLLLYRTVKIYGAYLIYASVLTYCYIVSWFVLPETKDRTLQDIEREFRSDEVPPDQRSEVHSLKSLTETST